MQFINNTPLPAAMIANSEDNDLVTALFLCAVTYSISERGIVLASAQQPLALHSDGVHLGDAMLLKTGVSVCATGFVYPRRSGDTQTHATLTIDGNEIAIVAFGPRVWERSAFTGTLTPSRPLPFERVAMTWQNAYGGVTQESASVVHLDGEEAFVPAHQSGYPYNFDGIGFHTSERDMLHQALPPLEKPDQLLQRWTDHPEPVCFAPYPLRGGLRAAFVMRGGQFDASRISRIASRAAPRNTFAHIAENAACFLHGMRPGGNTLGFTLPPSPVVAHAVVGSKSARVGLALDAVDIDAETAEMRLLYRATATYGVYQREIRTATLEPTEHFPAV